MNIMRLSSFSITKSMVLLLVTSDTHYQQKKGSFTLDINVLLRLKVYARICWRSKSSNMFASAIDSTMMRWY